MILSLCVCLSHWFYLRPRSLVPAAQEGVLHLHEGPHLPQGERSQGPQAVPRGLRDCCVKGI